MMTESGAFIRIFYQLRTEFKIIKERVLARCSNKSKITDL